MAPKRLISGENKPKRKNVVTTIERKKEIIDKYDKGARITDPAAEYCMVKSTAATILKNKEAIKGADVAMGVKKQLKRPAAVEEMEKLLMVWINERQMAGDSMSEGKICAKARRLHGDLICDTTSDSSEDFKASKRWFGNFKKRTGIHSVVRHGKAASADKVAAEKFVPEFKKFVDKERLSPQQVFNCDETGLFWKKLPSRTYITKEEKCLPGHKPNASGDCKIKPLLVYHSENPRPFKKNVKTYLIEKNLPLKALLLMDNAPAHPPGMEEELGKGYKFIRVMFLPPNTTPLIQPMDQNVIATFKKLYTKALFERCFEVTSETELTLREFWKNYFNILHCLRLIDKAWGRFCEVLAVCLEKSVADLCDSQGF
ncbi:tigger transposable element-derived protein 1-like [Eriocheir sinensis]|uniref:tigger transposable element-derived protein 1-like n=1 Tax=Eriocheir sinensis TaxID=95602 RepID=UPI0021C87748|nr:tigger transposable element-derived protein 1-like [Eriocheir sinensis]